MRIAAISDIHGNLTAFEAVLADLTAVGPDLVVHGGDLVGSGPSPAEVIDRIRDLKWPGVYGNTDEMLWNPDRVTDYFASEMRRRPWRAIVDRTIAATREAIGAERLDWLRALPARWSEHAVTVVHASPQ
jgi:predicted phosphodiesterase